MSALPSMSLAESAAAYERHINDNWDRLSPFEQDQARAYMQSKFVGAQQAQPGFPAAAPMYGYGYGYGPGAFGPPKREQGGGWAVPVGYIGLLVFTPLAIVCGIINLTKGRTGHGMAQLLISLTIFALTFMLLAAAP